MFEQLLFDQDDTTIQVVARTYTRTVLDLMIAARACREQTAQLASVGTTNGPAVNGGPARETLADLLSPRSLVGGSPWWRCRESNPGPSTSLQGFSGRSLRCLYSAPVIMQASSP
jgi:hypothetical protein